MSYFTYKNCFWKNLRDLLRRKISHTENEYIFKLALFPLKTIYSIPCVARSSFINFYAYSISSIVQNLQAAI